MLDHVTQNLHTKAKLNLLELSSKKFKKKRGRVLHRDGGFYVGPRKFGPCDGHFFKIRKLTPWTQSVLLLGIGYAGLKWHGLVLHDYKLMKYYYSLTQKKEEEILPQK